MRLPIVFRSVDRSEDLVDHDPAINLELFPGRAADTGPLFDLAGGAAKRFGKESWRTWVGEEDLAG
jgi:hypothetical protein